MKKSFLILSLRYYPFVVIIRAVHQSWLDSLRIDNTVNVKRLSYYNHVRILKWTIFQGYGKVSYNLKSFSIDDAKLLYVMKIHCSREKIFNVLALYEDPTYIYKIWFTRDTRVLMFKNGKN